MKISRNIMRIGTLSLAIILAFGTTTTFADPAPNAEATRLVRQLGDDDPAIRHRAAWHLREIGIPALPALREAADSDELEVRNAVRAAIKAIGVPLPEQGNGPYTTTTIRADNDYFSVDFGDGKRVVRIEGEPRKEGESSPHHLKVTFTGVLDGKPATQTFAADNEDDLKWNSPQAWKFYHSIFNHEKEMAAVRADDTILRNHLNAAMDKAKLPAAERAVVLGQMKKYMDAVSHALAAGMYEPDNAPAKLGEEFRASDALRKMLTEKKLPILEDQMQPPADSRLGAYFQLDLKFYPRDVQSGLLVKFAATGDRADRIGVRPGDIIQRIDGTDITSAGQLRELCRAKAAGMTIEVWREGKIVTLHEKGTDAPAGKPGGREIPQIAR